METARFYVGDGGIIDSNTGRYVYVREHDGKLLRDLLLREFPVAAVDGEECSVEFKGANGRRWACELPQGHYGLHAAPGVDEFEHRPSRDQQPMDELGVALAKFDDAQTQRRERIATAAMNAMRQASFARELPPDHVAALALADADALIAALDKGQP